MQQVPYYHYQVYDPNPGCVGTKFEILVYPKAEPVPKTYNIMEKALAAIGL
jgi:hypothetical protein